MKAVPGMAIGCNPGCAFPHGWCQAFYARHLAGRRHFLGGQAAQRENHTRAKHGRSRQVWGRNGTMSHPQMMQSLCCSVDQGWPFSSGLLRYAKGTHAYTSCLEIPLRSRYLHGNIQPTHHMPDPYVNPDAHHSPPFKR